MKVDDKQNVGTNTFFNETDENKYNKLSAELEEQIVRISNLESSLEKQVKEVSTLKNQMNTQIQEVSALKTQMFGVVGFLITIFTFISAATDFYKPILDLVKMFSIDMLAQHSFNFLNFVIDLMFLALPILFIYVTFRCAASFFTKMAK